MRLTCPNCGAQYDVDTDVIPENGRDVQCSSCGNTWFQKSGNARTATEETNTPDNVAAAETVISAPDSVDDTSEPEQIDDAPDEAIETPADEAESPEPAAPPSGLDQGVTDILRAEAERETAERSSGIAETTNITDPIVENISSALAAQSAQVDVDMSDQEPEHRSDLLPDIEEINSTLAADEATDVDHMAGDETVTGKKSGFRRGFIFAVVVFAVMALVYVFARQIADAVPQMASALSAYVDWVNQLRQSVDAILLKAVDKLTGLLAQLNSDSTG